MKDVFSEVAHAPDKLERFFPGESDETSSSFWKRELGRKSYDKVDLATRVAPHMTKEAMEERFDWKPQVDAIVALIRRWNE